ncbi:lytic transglycosylase domain-containing protein [Actinoplanes oblitus]|uniref:Lytic transglycosylase domain-containing protein n=1 Tax=Actinoplanes oblitus TaxID=3040509 RepID=A0ABY8WMZ2_9ACTN|nr:lytic transglycosylase domain-containing protein [Actinoplanes oblitus]WIM99229.1 lytic transglycosylase domain-containing protein [Actinoplanes oblitus]
MTRIAIRVASVALLLAGLAAGVYVGRQRPARDTTPDAAQAEISEMQLLKDRQNEHAAARARQTVAENAARQKAAAVAKTASAYAKDLDKSVTKAKQAAAAAAAGPVAYAGPIPKSCNEFSGSRAIGCALTLQAGFGLDQFACLNKLWARESGWNYRAENRGSGAYGIPQSLPGSKMAAFGDDWKTNPATQIKWGLDYIKKRYDTPCGAWAHSEKYNNY